MANEQDHQPQSPAGITPERWRDKFTYKAGDIEILTPEELTRYLAERAARNGAPPPLQVTDEPANP